MKRFVMLTFLCCFCSLGLWAADYQFERDIPYRSSSSDAYVDSMCRLDVAYPVGTKDAPVVVWFHGGGLTSGSREIPQLLLTENIVIIGVEYRLSPKATTAEMLDDAAAAVAWTLDHIAKYGGSPDKIYLSGHSAGGYLISMVGLDKSLLAKYGKDADTLAGLIPFSGQVITHFETRNRMGMPPLQPLIDKTAPLYHIRKDCAPMLIITGDSKMELYGRYEENAYFWRMLKLAGHPDVTLYKLDGYDHGGMVDPAFPLLLRFIKEHEK